MNKSIVYSQSKFFNVSDTNEIIRTAFVVRIFDNVNSCLACKSKFYDSLILITNFFDKLLDDIFHKSKCCHVEKNEIYVIIWFTKRRKNRTSKINLNVIFIKFNAIVFCTFYANAKKTKLTFINKNSDIFKTSDVMRKWMHLFFENYSVAIVKQFSNKFF